MTPADAAKVLGLPENSTAEQLESRFMDVRRKLEDKIAKAPTPGLQAKYRESLAEITAAFETLTLAADSSALPVLMREREEGRKEKERGAETGDRRPEAGSSGPAPGSFHPAPAPRRKSGSEFIIVALIAVAVLAAGGWWVMKVRAEKAEAARLAAAAKAEAEAKAEAKAAAEKAEAQRRAAEEKRLAEETRLAAEAKRQAEEAEKARLAAAEKAEQQRRDKLATEVRVQLGEAKLAWSQLERELPEAERTLSELRAEERSIGNGPEARRTELAARIQAQSAYNRWLGAYLSAHPVLLQQLKGTEMLSGRLVDEAAQVAGELPALIAAAKREILSRKQAIDDGLFGSLAVENSYPDAQWTFVDAFGRKWEGAKGITLPRVGAGGGTITFVRSGWPADKREIFVRGGESARVTADFPLVELSITTKPAAAEIYVNGESVGGSPVRVTLPPGERTITARLAGYKSTSLTLKSRAGESLAKHLDLELLPFLTDKEIADFAATLPPAGGSAFVEWTGTRIPVPNLPEESGERVGVAFFTMHEVAMSLTQAPPASAPNWFTAAPQNTRAGALGGSVMGLVAGGGSAPASPPVQGPYAVFMGYLHARNPEWIGNTPIIQQNSNLVMARSLRKWLQDAAKFTYPGQLLSWSPPVYVLVKYRAPDSR